MCYGSCCLCSGIGIISDLHQHHPDQHNLWSTKLSENDLPYMVLPGAIIVPLFLLPFQNSRTRRHLLMSHNTWSVDYVDLGGQLAVQIWIHTISDMFCSELWSWPLSQTVLLYSASICWRFLQLRHIFKHILFIQSPHTKFVCHKNG